VDAGREPLRNPLNRSSRLVSFLSFMVKKSTICRKKIVALHSHLVAFKSFFSKINKKTRAISSFCNQTITIISLIHTYLQTKCNQSLIYSFNLTPQSVATSIRILKLKKYIYKIIYTNNIQ